MRTIEIEFENDFYRKLEIFCKANEKEPSEYIKECFLSKYLIDMYGDLNEKGKKETDTKTSSENEKPHVEKKKRTLSKKKSNVETKEIAIEKRDENDDCLTKNCMDEKIYERINERISGEINEEIKPKVRTIKVKH